MSPSPPRRRTVLAAVLATAALGVTACGGGGSDPLAAENSGGSSDTIIVGSANFAENVLLGEMYAQALEAKGFKVERKLNIGSREVLYGAMQDGSINVLPEYNGALLSFVDVKDASITTEAVDAALKAKLPADLAVLEASPAEDKNTVAVTQATADKYNLKTIADLAPIAPTFSFGAAPEDKVRQQGLIGLQDVYGLKFKEFRALDTAGPLTINALAKNTVQAAILYSTTPEIEQRGFVALTDPKNVFGSQNIIPFVNTKSVPADAQTVLNSISKALDTTTLTALNAKVQIDKDAPEDVAKEWLKEKGLV